MIFTFCSTLHIARHHLLAEALINTIRQLVQGTICIIRRPRRCRIKGTIDHRHVCWLRLILHLPILHIQRHCILNTGLTRRFHRNRRHRSTLHIPQDQPIPHLLHLHRHHRQLPNLRFRQQFMLRPRRLIVARFQANNNTITLAWCSMAPHPTSHHWLPQHLPLPCLLLQPPWPPLMRSAPLHPHPRTAPTYITMLLEPLSPLPTESALLPPRLMSAKNARRHSRPTSCSSPMFVQLIASSHLLANFAIRRLQKEEMLISTIVSRTSSNAIIAVQLVIVVLRFGMVLIVTFLWYILMSGPSNAQNACARQVLTPVMSLVLISAGCVSSKSHIAGDMFLAFTTPPDDQMIKLVIIIAHLRLLLQVHCLIFVCLLIARSMFLNLTIYKALSARGHFFPFLSFFLLVLLRYFFFHISKLHVSFSSWLCVLLCTLLLSIHLPPSPSFSLSFTVYPPLIIFLSFFHLIFHRFILFFWFTHVVSLFGLHVLLSSISSYICVCYQQSFSFLWKEMKCFRDSTCHWFVLGISVKCIVCVPLFNLNFYVTELE